MELRSGRPHGTPGLTARKCISPRMDRVREIHLYRHHHKYRRCEPRSQQGRRGTGYREKTVRRKREK